MNENIKNIILNNAVFFAPLKVDNQSSAIQTVVKMTLKSSNLSHEQIDAVANQVIQREGYGSTAFGKGLAFPHCKTTAVTDPYFGWFVTEQPMDFNSLDDEPVKIICNLLTPATKLDLHLRILEVVFNMLRIETFRTNLASAKSETDIRQIITDHINSST